MSGVAQVREECRVDEQSSASQLHGDTRARAQKSLPFFLTRVVGLPETVVADGLHRLPTKSLTLFATAILFWCKLQKGCQVVNAADHDAVRWLFPEVR